jgi:hypothetical protein
MSKDWDKVADEQFQSMPKGFREDWSELRKLVNQNK